MLDLKFIRENISLVKKSIAEKGEEVDIDFLMAMDENIRKLKGELQELLTQQNANSKKIPSASKKEKEELIKEGTVLRKKIHVLRPSLKNEEEKLKQLLYQVPAIPSPLAPRGESEEDNVEIKKWGKLPDFSFSPKDHVDILEQNNWAEFKRIAKVCGARSYGLYNSMVRLEMAIHRLALDVLEEKGFSLVSTPSLVREDALYGTGHFPRGREQVYELPEDNLFLSGTAEIQLNYLHSGEILSHQQLPILYAGRSSCFRREAGSYGRDVRGLIRVHEFVKVEQYIICQNREEESLKWHQHLLQTSEEIVQNLELPYRVVDCCTGDMGSGKVRMYDIECFVPSEKKYRETHSCSAFHDWQARRSHIRYRDKQGKVHFAHTLNNTAVATPRILVSFLECHQLSDGTVNIPPKLRPYLKGQSILK